MEHTEGVCIVEKSDFKEDVYQLYIKKGEYDVRWIGESDEDNANHLASCWNACKGMDTETLTRFGIGNIYQTLQTQLSTITKQRDELLEALKGVSGYAQTQLISIESYVANYGPYSDQEEVCMWEVVLKTIQNIETPTTLTCDSTFTKGERNG